MLIGYMRVSTDGDRQVLDLQRDLLITPRPERRTTKH
jgi:DNA invertase Pin-like site-specific DNA recombinase